MSESSDRKPNKILAKLFFWSMVAGIWMDLTSFAARLLRWFWTGGQNEVPPLVAVLFLMWLLVAIPTAIVVARWTIWHVKDEGRTP